LIGAYLPKIHIAEIYMTWFLIFAAAVFALYFLRQHRSRQKELDSPLADHRLGLRHIGESLVLEQPIQNNSGRIYLGKREWNVRGPNLPVGSRVRVTGVDGSVLLVDRTAA
jgi:membrane protein implicated in regulation of membrane protease activity